VVLESPVDYLVWSWKVLESVTIYFKLGNIT